MASSLSSVPPVWPRPRPLIIGNGRAPPAATIGARMSEVLSPTPPVECLSTFFHRKFEMIDHFAGVQHHFGQRRRFRVSKATDPGGHEPCRHLVIRNFAFGVAADEESDFLTGMFPGIAFFSNEVDGTHAIGNEVRD